MRCLVISNISILLKTQYNSNLSVWSHAAEIEWVNDPNLLDADPVAGIPVHLDSREPVIQHFCCSYRITLSTPSPRVLNNAKYASAVYFFFFNH